MTRLKNSRRRRGNAIVEAAIAFPLLFLMMLGASDFARVLHHAVTVDTAANAGAFYAAQSNIFSGHTDDGELVAKSDAKDVKGVTAEGDRFCNCPGSSTPVDCVTGSCPGPYLYPRVYVRMKVRHTFDTLVPHPYLPETTNVARDAVFRVQ